MEEGRVGDGDFSRERVEIEDWSQSREGGGGRVGGRMEERVGGIGEEENETQVRESGVGDSDPRLR